MGSSMSEKQVIYVDDWNCVYRQIPYCIVENSRKIIERGIFYQNRELYQELGLKLKKELGSLGEYEIINYLSGSQAIDNAVIICKKYLNITAIIKMKHVYHGIDMMQVEENTAQYMDLPLEFILIDKNKRLDISSIISCRNGLVIIEPMYLFAKYGEKANKMIHSIYDAARKNNHLILFDEVRSGVWSMGTFLYAQQFEQVVPDIICFSKGLGLGVATSVACFLKDRFEDKKILKNEDIIKSNLSLSELAMQRANDLLDYCMKEKTTVLAQINAFEKKMKESFQACINKTFIEEIHIRGLVYIIVFSKDVNKSKCQLFRQYLLANGIIVRHIEENLLYLNFAIDSLFEEIDVVTQKICEALEVLC